MSDQSWLVMVVHPGCWSPGFGAAMDFIAALDGVCALLPAIRVLDEGFG